jgi:hypothetical protein
LLDDDVSVVAFVVQWKEEVEEREKSDIEVQ